MCTKKINKYIYITQFLTAMGFLLISGSKDNSYTLLFMVI